VGSISQYAETRKDANFALFRKEKAQYTVGMEFRILDAETGATRLAESAVGTADKEGRVGGLFSGKKQAEGAPSDGAVMDGQGISGGYGEAARAAVDLLIAKLRIAFPIEGYIADVDPDSVTIDLGRSDNISVGDRFKVVKEGKEIIDPVTKEKLGAKTVDVGEVQVTGVTGDRLSTAKVVSSTGKVEIGNKVIAISMQALAPPPPPAATEDGEDAREKEKEKTREERRQRRHHDDEEDDHHHDH
jgi:ribosomal protein L12E/L44/L45/RPP1/RPP2